MALIGDVKDKHAIQLTILLIAVVHCAKSGSNTRSRCVRVRAYIHMVISNGAEKKIDASKLEELVVSDSIPFNGKSSKIRQVSVAPLFGEAMRRITNEESVSSLFI